MDKISIVIVTWNSGRVIGECLGSLFSHVPAEGLDVILVDNASEDPSYLESLERLPSVRVFRNSDNLGFAKAVNIGARHAVGSHLLILNPDMLFVSNPFPRLLTELSRDPEIGVIGPLLHGTDGKPQIEHFYPNLPSVWQFICFRSVLAALPPVRKLALRHFHARVGTSGVFFVDQIPGAFLLFRRNLFGDAPPLNEAYYIWMEDVDFCLTVHRMGLKVAVVADEKVTHIGGFSFKTWSMPRRMWMFNQSYLTYLELHFSPAAYLVHTAVMAVNSIAFLIATPFYFAPRGHAFVGERLRSEARVLGLILARTARRFFRTRDT